MLRAMSQENVKVVRRFNAFARLGIGRARDAHLDLPAPSCVGSERFAF